MNDNVILEVKNLKKYFKTSAGLLHAVDDVSFTIDRGKTLGIVGESGCGKTTTGRSILRLVEPTSGEVHFDGADILSLNKREMRKMRQQMQLIFQDPFSSLNPKRTVCQTIEEALKLTGEYRNSDERFHRVLEIMEMVGLDERLINAYPHEMDGGRRTASASRDRPGPGHEAEVHRLRRTGLCPRRFHPGADPEHAPFAPERTGSDLYLHHP